MFVHEQKLEWRSYPYADDQPVTEAQKVYKDTRESAHFFEREFHKINCTDIMKLLHGRM
jgi:hypothetical protein